MTKEKQKGEGLKMYDQEPEWGPQDSLEVLCLSSATHLRFALPVSQCLSWAVSIQHLNSGCCCMFTTFRPPRKQVSSKLMFPLGGENWKVSMFALNLTHSSD